MGLNRIIIIITMITIFQYRKWTLESEHLPAPAFLFLVSCTPTQAIGVNAIELLPIFEFNELENYSLNPATQEYRVNFWGYSTVAFFAPMARYASGGGAGNYGRDSIREFKTLVRECHRRGIEVRGAEERGGYAHINYIHGEMEREREKRCVRVGARCIELDFHPITAFIYSPRSFWMSSSTTPPRVTSLAPLYRFVASTIKPITCWRPWGSTTTTRDVVTHSTATTRSRATLSSTA